MNRVTHVQPSHGDQNASKAATLRPTSVQAVFEAPQYYRENSPRPNTPSMTNGSSRSNSSSIISCETCGNPGNHCSCSDTEKARVFNAEERRNSPYSSPALLASPGTGKISAHVLRLRQPGRCLPYPRGTSRIPTYSIPGSGHHFELPTIKQYALSHPSEEALPRYLAAENESLLPKPAVMCLTSDSEAEEDEYDSDDSDEGDEDNDWSGQDTSLEAIILNVVSDDLPLAAHLIPILHRALRCELTANSTEKLGSWRNGIIKSVQGTTEQTSASYATEQPNNPRKRQRHQGDSKSQSRRLDEFGEGEEDDDDDDPQESKGVEDDIGTASHQPLPFLACPFHKRDPAKYNIQYGDVEASRKTQYRSCGGPGFKSMQRLKEHLKRKHYPVQCDRCYHIFPGSDRATCVLELQRHRQLPTPCERGPDSGKEGISEAQWANLDKKKSSKKSQMMSRIALWMDYWDILFPGIRQPETPWYDNQIPNRLPQPTSEDVRRFAELFRPMLNLKVSQQHIRFLEGQEDVMKSRVEDLVYQAFRIYLGLNGSPSATNSSSSRSNHQSSLLGGSFQHLSTPTSRARHSSSASRSTAAQSQAYSVDAASSPVAHRMVSRSLSQGHTTRVAPLFMSIPRIPTQNFTSRPMPSSMPNEHQDHERFHPNMAGSIGNFGGDPFVGNSLGAGESQWQLGFDSGNPSFFGGHPAANLTAAGFVDISPSPLDQILDSSDDNGGNLGFEQYQNPENLRYDGTQQ